MIKDVRTINKTAAPQNPWGTEESCLPIPATDERWRQELAAAFRDPARLLERLSLPVELLPIDLQPNAENRLPGGNTGFGLLVPESFVARMQPGDRDDPLLLQVLPSLQEDENSQGFTQDAVGDAAARMAPGLLQKYQGRALLITVGACAVHCRYCFRRHYEYEQEPRSRRAWQATLAELETRPDIEEIILSGGDPLVLTDRRLAELLDDLEAIPQLTRLRIHSRLPIVLPSRITVALLERLQHSRLQCLFVVHANHPAEIAGDCAEGLRSLVRAGIPTLNQAVLLRDINDTTAVQSELCRRLINLGVIPYYLHQLDQVAGTAHFEVPPDVGLKMIAELTAQLPGYAVPRYVREIAGEASKTEVAGRT